MQSIADPPVSVLDQIVHKRLIQDLQGVCEVANIPPSFVHQSMKNHCGEKEVEWVRRYNALRNEGVAGIVLDGVSNSQNRCLAIGGALLRNFIDARVLSLSTLIGLKDDVPEPSVLIVPNFYLKSVGKSNVAWKGQVMYDLLMSRLIAGKPSVLFVEDYGAMEQEYGPMIGELLKNNFWLIPE